MHRLITCAIALALLATGCDAIRRVPDARGGERTVEVAVFEGGYGIGWHQQMAAQYNAAHAAERVRIELWGDPRAVDKVRPRILRGDPPDVLLMSKLPIWLLITTGKLRAFDEALDRPAHGSDVSWRDLFVPGTLDAYTADGKTYGIPTAFGAWACWYDAKLFRAHGWETPRTWKEFLALCGDIQAEGIAPVAFQGKYPIYAWWTFITFIQRVGGLEAINRINKLGPGAFSHADVVEAARRYQDLAQRYFEKGALAMTHTESQLQWVNGKAAMIFCGLWLYNEMKATLPADFEMRCFNFPAIEGGKGNPRLFNGEGAEYLFVTTASRAPEAAVDFARYLVSPENAPGMAAQIGVISPLKGGALRENVPPALQSALDMIESADGIFSVRLMTLLLTWRVQVMEPGLAALLDGSITPEAFCAALDAGVVEALKDPDLIVPEPVLYDPRAFGEGK